jgi:hypothetical protein
MSNNKLYEFDHAIFFDNSLSHIDDVQSNCPGIECILTKETAEKPPSIPFTNKGLAALIESLKPNAYTDHIQTITKSDTYDAKSGISDLDIDTFNIWEKQTRPEKSKQNAHRVLLLDWDRTITKVEGFLLPPSIPKIDPKDVVVYLCGGKERFDMLQTWLADVTSKGIEIMIVTNNSGCNWPVFRYLADAFMPNIKPDQIVCGVNFGYHKSLAIMNDPRFSKLGKPYDEIHKIYYPSSKRNNNSNNNAKFTSENLDKLLSSTLHNMNAGKRHTRRKNQKAIKRRGTRSRQHTNTCLKY